ncbi:TPA: hypothetical protein ACHOZF_004138 [Raoultella planticola]
MNMKERSIYPRKELSKGQTYWLLMLLGFSAGVFFIFVSYNVIFSSVKKLESYKKDFYKKESSALKILFNVSVDMNLLTHRLIVNDLQRGIADETVTRRAIGKVNQYLNDVDRQCKSDGTDKGNAAFVACAGHLIGQHFYYTPSIDVSNNYAVNRSDCDTNTYLLMDAAHQHGIDSYIMYAPSHAFFAWRDSTGHFQYWETTSSNNKGEVPELSHDFYEKNFSHSYYTPFNGGRVEDIYSTLTYDIANVKPDLDAIYKKYPDDAFVSSWYYYAKAVDHKLTKNDARVLLDLLQMDITSSDKRYALIQYFLSVSDYKRANCIFKTIDLKRCGEDCFQTGVDLGLKRYQYTQQLFNWYSGKLKNKANNKNIKANVGDFFSGLILVVMGGGLTIISIIGSGILLIRNKKINERISIQTDG